ncbi:MAG: hypothetical protein RLZZ595_21 [Bacteroidota bacterium]|jgi:hypothetical protein
MKIFNWIMVFVFVVFALLQFNDPDPYLWIPVYGYTALVCMLNARNKFDSFANYGLIIFCFIYGIKLIIATDGVFSWLTEHEAENLVQSMKAKKPWIENTREFGGLITIAGTALINIIKNKKAGIL